MARIMEVRELTNANLGQLTAGVLLKYAGQRAVELRLPREVHIEIAKAKFELIHGAWTKLQALRIIEKVARTVQVFSDFDADMDYYMDNCYKKITQAGA